MMRLCTVILKTGAWLYLPEEAFDRLVALWRAHHQAASAVKATSTDRPSSDRLLEEPTAGGGRTAFLLSDIRTLFLTTPEVREVYSQVRREGVRDEPWQ